MRAALAQSEKHNLHSAGNSQLLEYAKHVILDGVFCEFQAL
jgi:hypothetical protein